MRKKIVAGNWKMNMNKAEANALFNDINGFEIPEGINVVVAPPSLYLTQFAVTNSKLKLASQNVSHEMNGAFTGEISAEMLSSIDLTYSIVGHSERRAYNGENDKLISKKIDSLLSYNLTPIYCCGELKSDRESENHENVVETQIKEALFHLSNDQISCIIIAYEPVWAIGTGLTASAKDAQQMHAHIRIVIAKKYGSDIAENISILYGGSCKPENAKELFSQSDIDGGLIGGAALNADSFKEIIYSF
ncbi:MAG: triose-phosphate isomerase [Flavobacteriales bacterium]|nr:triose-phosphate isomerase [Flavobacteriales bacterium]